MYTFRDVYAAWSKTVQAAPLLLLPLHLAVSRAGRTNGVSDLFQTQLTRPRYADNDQKALPSHSRFNAVDNDMNLPGFPTPSLPHRVTPTPTPPGPKVTKSHKDSSSGLATPSSLTMLSASPTCFRVLISRPRKRDRIIDISVNPWDRPLMTADCYCKGSELEESRLRWRYTSVPYPSILISFRSPPKYLAYSRLMGSP